MTSLTYGFISSLEVSPDPEASSILLAPVFGQGRLWSSALLIKEKCLVRNDQQSLLGDGKWKGVQLARMVLGVEPWLLSE